MITAMNLTKTFVGKVRGHKQSICAVKDVNFSAADGTITGLLGNNGAGKSTTMRMLAALIKPDSGKAIIDGMDIEQHSLAVRKTVGYLPHSAGLYTRLTARENIEYFAELCCIPSSERSSRTDELLETLGIRELADRKTEGFSQGQKTKVALARTLVHRPKNLLLDEPTNGLDVLSTRALRSVIRGFAAQGHCILLSSHIMQEIEMLCDKVVVIHGGCSIFEGSVEDLLRVTDRANIEEAFIERLLQTGHTA